MTIIDYNNKTTKVTKRHLVGKFDKIVVLSQEDLKSLYKLRGMTIDILFVPRDLEPDELEEVKWSVTGQIYTL